MSNDDFDAATVIGTTPFDETTDVAGATAAPDDPTDCYGTRGSVWYSVTPAEASSSSRS